MTEMFTKEQKVTLVAPWNSNGDFYTRDCIVHSCGKKVLRLIDSASGKTLGETFLPCEYQHAGNYISVVANEYEVADALEGEMQAWRTNKVRNVEAAIENSVTGSTYNTIMQAKLATLHAYRPTHKTYSEWCAQLS